MSSLQDRLNRNPEPWKPEEGDSVLGTVLEVNMRDGGYDEYPVVALETEDGREMEVHAFHTSLKNDVMKLELRPGDEFGCRYLGKRTSATGASYYAYRVVHSRGDNPEPSKVTPAAPLGTPNLTGDLLPGEEPLPEEVA